MKKWIVYCWLVALALISAQAMAQETEYQFGVRWSVNGLASSVDIQDIMLDFKGVPSEQSTMLPITQYVRNGRNALQFYAWPVPSAEPFEVVMMPGVEDAKPEVVSINSAAPVQPRESGISWDQDYFKLTVSFNNRQPMPTWCWDEGDVLRDNDATRDSLSREYRRLHALFAAGDNEALLDAAATRTEELALASGTSEEYVRHRFSYDMYFDNPDIYQLDDLPDHPMTLNLAADNRVAWLTEEGVNQPLRFKNIAQEGRSAFISIYFIRRDGQWEICR